MKTGSLNTRDYTFSNGFGFVYPFCLKHTCYYENSNIAWWITFRNQARTCSLRVLMALLAPQMLSFLPNLMSHLKILPTENIRYLETVNLGPGLSRWEGRPPGQGHTQSPLPPAGSVRAPCSPNTPAACLLFICLWLIKATDVGGWQELSTFPSSAIRPAMNSAHMAPIRVNGRHVSNLEGKIGKIETAADGDPPVWCWVRWTVQSLLTCLCDFLVA